MTVAELKKVLENLEDDMEVMVETCDYGDYNIDNAYTKIVYPEHDKPFLAVY